MDAQTSLADLYAGYSLPMDQYKKLPAFQYMELHPELVEKVESLHLPEITKLICGSQAFAQKSWSDGYKKIRTYICSPDKVDVSQLVLSCKTINYFEREILPYANEQILTAIQKDYADLTEQKEKVSKKYELLRSKGIASESNSNEKRKPSSAMPCDVQVQEYEKELRDLQMFLEVEKPFVDAIILYREKETPDEIETRREQAFLLLDDTRSREEIFLSTYIQKGTISANERKLFHRIPFVQHLMDCLDTEQYLDFAFPVLLRLYDEGVIDLVEGPASDFLESHPEDFAGYLEQQSIDFMCMTEETELLIEKALKLELRGENVGTAFQDFWNTFTSEKSWIKVIKLLPEVIDEEQYSSAVSHMLMVVQEKAQEALLRVIFYWNDPDIYLAPEEVVATLSTESRHVQTDLLGKISKLWSQRCRDLQRKLNTAQRRLARQGQDLFSTVYRPIEQLEELAANLKATDGTIQTHLAAAQLMMPIEELRTGLQDLGIEPVIDPHEWKEQIPVAYNSRVHNVRIQHDKISGMVQISSMGFRYQDDEGNWQVHRAHAVEIDADRKEKSRDKPRRRSSDKDHPKVSVQKKRGVSKKKHRKLAKK